MKQWSHKYDRCQNLECTTPDSGHQSRGLCEGCISNLRYEDKERQEYQVEYYRKYYEDNKDRCKNQMRQWQKDNAEHLRRYRKDNPEIFRAKAASRRARKANNGGTHTGKDIKFLLSLANQQCLRCGELLGLEIDHVTPLSKGGRNDIANLQVLCKSCNSGKGNRNSDDYRSEEFKQAIKDCYNG